MSFEVIPAIDLRGGHCVRLFQGDYDRETRYSDDPLATAVRWQSLGAPRLHVVDLDGALTGISANRAVIAAICALLTIPIEVSGGIRTADDVAAVSAYGASRIQLGSIAVHNPAFVAAAVATQRDAIVVSIDARDGEVFTDGWTKPTGRRALEFAHEMVALGVVRIMFTDIGRDSTMTEPNFAALAEMVQSLGVPVVASGGVATIDHLINLATIGCEGAIVGKALYERAIDLPSAISAVATIRAAAVPDTHGAGE